VFSANDHQRALRPQRTTQVGEGAATSSVQNHVIVVAAIGEVFRAVVDHVVGADRAHQVGLRSAADTGDLGTIGFRDLHRE